MGAIRDKLDSINKERLTNTFEDFGFIKGVGVYRDNLSELEKSPGVLYDITVDDSKNNYVVIVLYGSQRCMYEAMQKADFDNDTINHYLDRLERK